MMTDLIQFVDENDNPIGQGTREEALEKAIHHRISRVILFNENGQILLQKRSSTKKIYPNLWTDSASGHVDAGEDYETAVMREMFEELGIKTDLKFIGKFMSQHVNGGMVTPVFNGVFQGLIDSNTIFNLQTTEVSEAKWFSIDEVKTDLSTNPQSFTPGFIDVISRYY